MIKRHAIVRPQVKVEPVLHQQADRFGALQHNDAAHRTGGEPCLDLLGARLR